MWEIQKLLKTFWPGHLDISIYVTYNQDVVVLLLLLSPPLNRIFNNPFFPLCPFSLSLSLSVVKVPSSQPTTISGLVSHQKNPLLLLVLSDGQRALCLGRAEKEACSICKALVTPTPLSLFLSIHDVQTAIKRERERECLWSHLNYLFFFK